MKFNRSEYWVSNAHDHAPLIGALHALKNGSEESHVSKIRYLTEVCIYTATKPVKLIRILNPEVDFSICIFCRVTGSCYANFKKLKNRRLLVAT